jgi:hypothetical protein
VEMMRNMGGGGAPLQGGNQAYGGRPLGVMGGMPSPPPPSYLSPPPLVMPPQGLMGGPGFGGFGGAGPTSPGAPGGGYMAGPHMAAAGSMSMDPAGGAYNANQAVINFRNGGSSCFDIQQVIRLSASPSRFWRFCVK